VIVREKSVRGRGDQNTALRKGKSLTSADCNRPGRRLIETNGSCRATATQRRVGPSRDVGIAG